MSKTHSTLPIHVSSTPQPDARDALAGLLEAAHTTPTLLLLSGGSALSLVEELPASALGPELTVSVVDERYTDDPQASNMGALERCGFLRMLVECGGHTIDPRPRARETLTACAARFEAELHAWHTAHPTGVVVATLGIGADGHTAGVLPRPDDPAFFNTQFLGTNFVAGYEVLPGQNPYPKRVTTTLSYLRERVTHALVYVIGTDKRSALRQVMETKDHLEVAPARVLHTMRQARVYTDIS